MEKAEEVLRVSPREILRASEQFFGLQSRLRWTDLNVQNADDMAKLKPLMASW